MIYAAMVFLTIGFTALAHSIRIQWMNWDAYAEALMIRWALATPSLCIGITLLICSWLVR